MEDLKGVSSQRGGKGRRGNRNFISKQGQVKNEEEKNVTKK